MRKSIPVVFTDSRGEARKVFLDQNLNLSVSGIVIDPDHLGRCPVICQIDRNRNCKLIVRKGCKDALGILVANEPVNEPFFTLGIKFQRLFNDTVLGKIPDVGLRKP